MSYALVAEGKANSIVRTPFGKLIRISKRGVSPRVIASYWNEFWRPKLGKYMGDMVPVLDPKYGFVLSVEEVGAKEAEIVAEFKPKWLHQSPAAPPTATCCRTCAIKTMRGQPNSWCSLDLGTKDPMGVQKCMQSVAQPEHAIACAELLLACDLLDELAHWQAIFMRTNNQSDLLHCMSLRDCTVLVEWRPEAGYACWLVDLDPKGGPGKTAKWQALEEQLAPYYTKFSPVCRLSRSP